MQHQGFPDKACSFSCGGEAYGKKEHSESADPHVWLDPVLMKTVVDKVKNALSKADPEGEAYYRREC